MDPETAQPLKHTGTAWTSIFGQEILAIADERPDVVAITAAMLIPVGLDPMARAHPGRVFDVGIAEQHATTSAAGLALGGMHPVVAVYATFLNRAFDQLVMDVALHRCGVTFVLDRAGVTGADGASHHGMWDLAMLQLVPGLRLAAPRDAPTLRAELREAVEVEDGPTVVRFPTGPVGTDIPAVDRVGGTDVLRQEGQDDVLIVAVGVMAETCLDVADRLLAQGVGVTVVDPRWVKPVDPALVTLAAGYALVVTVEDGLRAGGVGSAVVQAMRDADVATPVRQFGIPPRFLDHAKRAEIFTEIGLTAQDIARDLVEVAARSEGLRDELPAID
jgi:1-deoxy-D-xylulose-5-phosphate synthase